MRSTYRPSDRGAMREAARELWNDVPLLVPAIVMIGFGAVLIAPGDTFAMSHAWDVMRDLGAFSGLRETGLGWAYAFMGVACSTAYIVNGRLYPWAALATSALYLLVAACLALGTGAASTGTVCYFGMAVLSLWGPFHASTPPRAMGVASDVLP